MKNTTLYTYVQRRKYFTILDNIKLHELTVEDYKIWRNSLEETKLSVRYKNDILKFFKELLIFARNGMDMIFETYIISLINLESQMQLSKMKLIIILMKNFKNLFL